MNIRTRTKASLQSTNGDCLIQPLWLAISLLLFAMLPGAIPACAEGRYIANNTPRYVSTAAKLGREDISKIIEISIWLQPNNRDALDKLAQDLYNPNSPNYRHWLNNAEVAARFAPTPTDAKTVEDFVESKNLKVVRVGPNNFYIRARGSIADVENAFQVQLNDYQLGDRTFRANAGDPFVEGPAAAIVQVISGLDNAGFQHPFTVRPTMIPSSSATTSVTNGAHLAPASSAADSNSFESVCFPGPAIEQYTSGGSYPKAT